MARHLCLYERARVEAMAQAGFGAAEVAERLGRHRSTTPSGSWPETAARGGIGPLARRPRRWPGAPAQGLEADPGRRTGLGSGRAPRPAVVAPCDQRGPRGPGAAGVRGDHLPGVLWQFGRNRVEARVSEQAAPIVPPPKAPRPLRTGQTLGSGRVPVHSGPARRSRHQGRARPLGGRLGHWTQQPHPRWPHWSNGPAVTPWWWRCPAATTCQAPP